MISIFLSLFTFVYGLGCSLCWYMFCGQLKERVVCRSCVEYSINANQVLQVDGVVEFIFILLFLSRFFHQNSKREIEVSNYNCGFVCRSFQFYQFLQHIFCGSVIWCIHV